MDQLEAAREDTNGLLLQRLREDCLAPALLAACQEDASKGRMSEPKPLDLHEMAWSHFSPRFGIEQGKRPLCACPRPFHVVFMSACMRSATRWERESACSGRHDSVLDQLGYRGR